jgi:hypothetical protein
MTEVKQRDQRLVSFDVLVGVKTRLLFKNIQTSITGAQLKRIINDKLGEDLEVCHLLLDGVEITDENTLEDSKIYNGDVVVATLLALS